MRACATVRTALLHKCNRNKQHIMSTPFATDNERSDCVDKFLKEIGVGRRAICDPFFDETHKAYKIFQRTGVTIEDDEELCHDEMKEFPCNALGCKATFRNLLDFEIHYNGSHRYICQTCNKMMASARLLEIHIQETHDSYFKVLAERCPMYQCYVSECSVKLANPSERREHCTTVHKFPKNFRYDCENKKKREQGSAMEVQQDEEDRPVPKNTKIGLNKNQRRKTFVPGAFNKVPAAPNVNEESQMESCEIKSPVESSRAPFAKSSLAFIPRQVANRSYTNALTNSKGMVKNVLETKTLMDLAKSLPE